MVALSSKDHDQLGFSSDVQMLLLQKKVEKIPKLPRDFQVMYSEPNMANPANHLLQEHRDGYQQGRGQKETVREYRYQWTGQDIGKLNGEELKKFVTESTVDGSVSRWIRSSESMEPHDGMSYGAVGANEFEEKVLDKDYDVLLLYCSQWNRHCEEFMVEYNKLAKHVDTYYKGKNIKIMFTVCSNFL